MRAVIRLVLIAVLCVPSFAQHPDPAASGAGGIMNNVGVPPLINVGGGDAVLSSIQAIDFNLKAVEAAEKEKADRAEFEARRRKMVSDGLISALDLAAPNSAIEELNKAVEYLQQRHDTRQAALHFEKSVAIYPKFVSGHNNLGAAYIDLGERSLARKEFETAAKLDDKFAGSFLNLARLDISENDFAQADQHLTKAIALKPRDPQSLSVLAYVQHNEHSYQHCIATADRVHDLDHKGLANVHYIAASAAIALRDYTAAQRELTFFVQEDPHNPLIAAAQQNLDLIDKYNKGELKSVDGGGAGHFVGVVAGSQAQTFPDAERLRSELAALGNEGDEECRDCAVTPNGPVAAAPAPDTPHPAINPYVIQKTVDEVALYFTATHNGQYVNDLHSTDVTLADDGKPPARLIQFTPQAKLPMRLALLVDTSGSVEKRFSFEKKAAIRFLQGMLTNPADLAFVMGFSNQPQVTQEFTHDQDQLAKGVDGLQNGGGTALFDAISFAAWKLAAYPDRERTARVLVVLSDGEDNSSKISLRKAIQDASTAGVTVFAISTKQATGAMQGGSEASDYGGASTAADKVLVALCDRTGGEAMFPGEIARLGAKFDKLHDLIRNRYLIAYRPADFEANGHYRKVAVTATKDGQKLNIQTRKGYYARSDQPTTKQ